MVTIALLALFLVLLVIAFAIYRMGEVRATVKIPFLGFSLEAKETRRRSLPTPKQ